MRKLAVLVAAALASIAASIAAAAPPPPNPQIDMAGFLADAHAAARERESRRVDEATFIRMMGEPGTVVIDARSRAMYERRHIAGAVSLSFPDFTAETLARAIPHPTTRVLIYCNNNFANDTPPVMLKRVELALNIQTFINLYGYGYRNVYELADTFELKASRLEFESSRRR